MISIIQALVLLIACLHMYFLVLEMFMWTTPLGLKAFGLKPEFAEQSKVLAANQGLYNGFLAAGLIWSFFHPQPEMALQLKYFFLGCVAVAGIYGAATASKKILYVQAMPAILTLILISL